jgi:hypothetical protein
MMKMKIWRRNKTQIKTSMNWISLDEDEGGEHRMKDVKDEEEGGV